MSNVLSLLESVLGATNNMLQFLVNVLGIVLALVNLSRARLPAILLLFGCSIRLVVNVANSLFFHFVLPNEDLDHQIISLVLDAMSILALLATALIFFAVFAGRTRS